MAIPPLQRILMVEDDPDIQAIARLALEALGNFQVHMCSSGREALHHAPTIAPDLILLDVMMPEMDGPTTLGALRTIPQIAHTPVIFMTAKAQRHEIQSYQELGALDVIVKPFDPMTLASTVSQIWKRYHEQRVG